MNNQELLDAACPLINDMGAAFYFIPETLGVGKAMGLGGMEFYVQGRAGQMGNTEPEAVAAAFGYFKPALLKSVLDAANAKSEPRISGAAFMNACATMSRAKLSGVSNLEALVAVLDKVNNAADGDGLALYAAINSEKLAEDAAGRLLQLIAILREYRGSAHLIALRAAGVNSRTAHYMKRPDMWKQFGYTEEEAPVITDAIKAARAEAENITDRIVEPAYAVLSDAERTVLVDGLKEVKAALAA